MIRCTVRGDFKNTRNFLKRAGKLNFERLLEKYAEEGLQALVAATPVRTGRTAASWYYEIERDRDSISIYWKNSNVQDGALIAVILDYGHATSNGGYVRGRHFISPAIRPVFDKIAEAAWKEVVKK